MTRVSTDEKIVEFLLDDADLEALVETRIWGGISMPPRGANYKPPAGAAICLQTISGADDYTDLMRHEQVQFKCYAATRADADVLAGVLHGALQSQRTGTMKWARRTITARVLAEPDTGWIFAFTQYAIMIHQEE
jgi:hypothetical protein